MNRKQLIRVILYVLLAAVPVHIPSGEAFGGEAYHIDGNRVLLYKTINWWYDCLPESCGLLCGKSVMCQNLGNARIICDEERGTLEIRTRDGIAEQLSFIGSGRYPEGPDRFVCTYLNRRYFGPKASSETPIREIPLNRFFFLDLDRERIAGLKAIEEHLLFEISGRVHGLMSGKISLYPDGNLLRGCPESSRSRPQILLRIINAGSDELLAEYSALWQE